MKYKIFGYLFMVAAVQICSLSALTLEELTERQYVRDGEPYGGHWNKIDTDEHVGNLYFWPGLDRDCISKKWGPFPPASALGYDDEQQLPYQGTSFSPGPMKNQANYMAALYKIHIMPTFDKIVEVADLIAQKIAHDREFACMISRFKITEMRMTDPVTTPGFSDALFDSFGDVLPFIVIYANAGFGQQLIERLDLLLAGYDGVQLRDFPVEAHDRLIAYGKKRRESLTPDSYIAPRFNLDVSTRDGLRVSPLIYYAQGNADRKGYGSFGVIKWDTAAVNRATAATLYDGLKHYADEQFHSFKLEKDALIIPYYAQWFDPETKGALFYKDYFGPDDVRDFHLYLPDNSK